MVESSIFETDERHVLIIGYSEGDPEVHQDVKVVEAFAKKKDFTSITVLLEGEATVDAIVDYFTQQEQLCLSHEEKNTSEKYLLMVYYSGHGAYKINALELELRKFNNRFLKNSCVMGIFVSCQRSKDFLEERVKVNNDSGPKEV